MKKKTTRKQSPVKFNHDKGKTIKVLNPTVEVRDIESFSHADVAPEKQSIETSIYNLGELFDGIGAAIIIYQKRIDALTFDAQNTLDRLKSINKELAK